MDSGLEFPLEEVFEVEVTAAVVFWTGLVLDLEDCEEFTTLVVFWTGFVFDLEDCVEVTTADLTTVGFVFDVDDEVFVVVEVTTVLDVDPAGLVLEVFCVDTTVLTTGLVFDVDDEVFVVVELTTVLDTGFAPDDVVVFVVETTVLFAGFAFDVEDDVFVVVLNVFDPPQLEHPESLSLPPHVIVLSFFVQVVESPPFVQLGAVLSTYTFAVLTAHSLLFPALSLIV